MSEEGEDEADAIRKKKQAQQQKLVEAKKAEEQLKTALRVVLDTAAYDRISNVRHANQELYVAAAQYVIALYKRFGQRINEEQLLTILRKIKEQSGEKEKQIRFERK